MCGAPHRRSTTGYAIAAYVVVLGSLLLYGWHLYARRRELMRRRAAHEAEAAAEPSR
jgi:hypothetical protein